jgi:AraC-like DNA-binding protein
VHHVIEMMHERLPDDLPIEQLARIAAMSPFHFSRTFRRITGVPPRRFLTALRIHRARRLLLTTDGSITDVCFDVGYNSLGTFVRRFTELTGCCPTRVRAFAQTTFPSLADVSPTEPAGAGSIVAGETLCPQGFAGIVFVALFSGPLPEGLPAACTIAPAGGAFRLVFPGAGTFYLFAVGIAGHETASEIMLCDTLPRGGGQRLDVRPGIVNRPPAIALHRPALEDPPILSFIPVLLNYRRQPPAASPALVRLR